MANTAYTYVIVDDFTYDVAEPERLEQEVADSDPAITSATLLGTACDGDPQNPTALTELSVWFDDPLSGADETQLDALVAAHDGRTQTKDINTTSAALATTDKLLLQPSDDPTDESIALSKDGSNNMMFQDAVQTTPVSLTTLVSGAGGLSEATHKALDLLQHNIAEDAHQQVTRSSGKISNITYWTDSGETTKIRELALTRSSGLISQIDLIQYASGTENVRITGTVTRSGGKVDHIDWVETVA